MGKKSNGKGKVIGLSRDYYTGACPAPYVLLRFNGKKYVPDGALKNLRNLVPFIERGSFSGITPSARETLMDYILSNNILKHVKKLEIISL